MNILRYPKSSDRSLKAWNASDELIIRTVLEDNVDIEDCILLHDLFGYLSCHLNDHKPQAVITFASQEFSIQKNSENNSCSKIQPKNILEHWTTSKSALMRIPKSLGLFEFYLARLCEILGKNGVVYCGFMTKYFTPSWLKLAEKYFEEVNQSLAHKKSRLLILKKPIKSKLNYIESFKDDNDIEWQQYLGVFSSGRIDSASRFFMEHLEVPTGDIKVVDVGSGNGVLSKHVQTKNPDAEIHLVDDNSLATLSSKLNIKGDQIHHHFSRNLDFLDDNSCDLVISNPPFHFEYELNLDVAFRTFKDAYRILKKGGELWVVANNNLAYKPQMLKSFDNCVVIAQNRKFNIYRCKK